MKKSYDILMVDDHKIIRDGIRMYFDEVDDLHVKDEAASGIEALSKLSKADFDLVITDLSMPEMDGITLTQRIKRKYPNQKVMALTMMGESQHIKHTLAAGVNGYILKNCDKVEILSAVRTILDGEYYFSNTVTKIVLDKIAGKSKPTSRLGIETPLTAREKEVLKLIVREYSNVEIAETLCISKNTVHVHKQNLLEKTKTKNIAGLAVYALEHNLD